MILSETEKPLAAVLFAYSDAKGAVRALHSAGDEVSAVLINKVADQFKSGVTTLDLSHSTATAKVELHVTRQTALQIVSGLIESYDKLRVSEKGDIRPSLRQTLSILFDLREVLSSNQVIMSQARQTAASWLDSPISSYPVSTATANKMKKAGFTTLRQLHGKRTDAICGLCGISEKQLSHFDDTVEQFLLASINQVAAQLCPQIESAFSRVLGQPVSASTDGVAYFLKRRMSVDNADVSRRSDWENLADLFMLPAEEALDVNVSVVAKVAKLTGNDVPWSRVTTELGKRMFSKRLVEQANTLSQRLKTLGVQTEADLIRCSEELFRSVVDPPEPSRDSGLEAKAAWIRSRPLDPVTKAFRALRDDICSREQLDARMVRNACRLIKSPSELAILDLG